MRCKPGAPSVCSAFWAVKPSRRWALHRHLGGEAEPTLSAPKTLGTSQGRSASPLAHLYDRGFCPYHKALPHCDVPGQIQFITYRLADSLPTEAFAKLAEELLNVPIDQQGKYRRRRIEEWADAGYGACLLRDPQIAALVVENWQHYDGVRYQLLAWCVMPNHVHLLVKMGEEVALGKVIQGWKGYTGKRIQQLGGGKPGPIWQREYWDRYIRDERHFLQAIEYIHQNPVKAGLVQSAEQWVWSSYSLWTLGSPSAEQTLGAPKSLTHQAFNEE